MGWGQQVQTDPPVSRRDVGTSLSTHLLPGGLGQLPGQEDMPTCHLEGSPLMVVMCGALLTCSMPVKLFLDNSAATRVSLVGVGQELEGFWHREFHEVSDFLALGWFGGPRT